MGYGQRLRVQKSADVRVLKAQLDLIADVIYVARFVGPFWALVIAWLGSAEFGRFGHTPFRTSLLLPIAVTIATVAGARLVLRYKQDASRRVSSEQLEAWFPRFIGIQIAISSAWGVMSWVLWDSSNPLNHVFLIAAVVAVLASLLISRANHIDMFVACMLPLVILSALRFVLSGSLLDVSLAIALPIFAAQSFYDGRRLTSRLDEDLRLRFEVEDLARELEEARDEALRKRFEAETANASKTAFLAR